MIIVCDIIVNEINVLKLSAAKPDPNTNFIVYILLKFELLGKTSITNTALLKCNYAYALLILHQRPYSP